MWLDPDLVKWAWEADLLTEEEVEELLRSAEIQPREANNVLERARSLREAIYRIFVAEIKDQPPAETDMVDLNQALSSAMQSAFLKYTPHGFVWCWGNRDNSLDKLLKPIVRSAAVLLTSKKIARVGQCADDRGCGFLFLDTSKNRSRRWCNMENCGNRAKQRRYYLRNQPANG